jgi:hypothetical protein
MWRLRAFLLVTYLLGMLDVEILEDDNRLESQDEVNFQEDGVLSDMCPYRARRAEALELR